MGGTICGTGEDLWNLRHEILSAVIPVNLDSGRMRPERASNVILGIVLSIPIKEYTKNGMKITTLKDRLRAHPKKVVRFVLPDGDAIPARFHVTEVGHITRRFIDCGGMIRQLESCLLQTWVPEGDGDHRLSAGKLAKILDLSRQVVPSDELAVEVEYDCCVVAQYTLEESSVQDDVLTFALGNKKTDCLAREACGVEPAAAGSGCCGGKGCGCG